MVHNYQQTIKGEECGKGFGGGKGTGRMEKRWRRIGKRGRKSILLQM
jgi:hypothetical protein